MGFEKSVEYYRQENSKQKMEAFGMGREKILEERAAEIQVLNESTAKKDV